MKVSINEKYRFTTFFENKLKLFLKKEFIKHIGMEVPNLYLTYREIETDNSTGISSVKKIGLSWYTGGSVQVRSLSWRSKSMKSYTGREEIDQDDVEIWMEGLEYFVQRLREQIPPMFKKQFWPDYRFIVEVHGLGMDTLITIETDKNNFEDVVRLIEVSFNEWNESGDGLIHSFSPIQSRNKLKIRIDTGSAGEPGIKYLVQSLNDSQLDITKIILSDANV